MSAQGIALGLGVAVPEGPARAQQIRSEPAGQGCSALSGLLCDFARFPRASPWAVMSLPPWGELRTDTNNRISLDRKGKSLASGSCRGTRAGARGYAPSRSLLARVQPLRGRPSAPTPIRAMPARRTIEGRIHATGVQRPPTPPEMYRPVSRRGGPRPSFGTWVLD